jgi:hypothetical protein
MKMKVGCEPCLCAELGDAKGSLSLFCTTLLENIKGGARSGSLSEWMPEIGPEATQVYEKAGMRVRRQYDQYELELRPGIELSVE